MKELKNIVVLQNVTGRPLYRKPRGIEFFRLQGEWRTGHYTLDDLIEYISLGHYWTSLFSNNNRVSRDNFISTNCIVVDINLSDVDMDTYLNHMKEEQKPMPTFAYTTWDEGKNNFHYFKLVYCFGRDILQLQFTDLYNKILQKIGVIPDYNHKVNCAIIELHCGNPTETFECYRSNLLYDIIDFV